MKYTAIASGKKYKLARLWAWNAAEQNQQHTDHAWSLAFQCLHLVCCQSQSQLCNELGRKEEKERGKAEDITASSPFTDHSPLFTVMF